MKKVKQKSLVPAKAVIPLPDADGVGRTDIRFDGKTLSLLKSLVGKKMSRVLYQCLVGKDDAYGRVFFDIEGEYYQLSNFTEPLRYMGVVEDVAVYRFESVNPSDVEEARQDEKMLDVPVNRVIERIQVVNENQRLFEDGTLAEVADIVRGLVFVFDDATELSAEKNTFFFLEEIYVKFGKDLLDGYEPLEEGFLEGWDEVPGCVPEASREVVTISGPTDGDGR